MENYKGNDSQELYKGLFSDDTTQKILQALCQRRNAGLLEFEKIDPALLEIVSQRAQEIMKVIQTDEVIKKQFNVLDMESYLVGELGVGYDILGKIYTNLALVGLANKAFKKHADTLQNPRDKFDFLYGLGLLTPDITIKFETFKLLDKNLEGNDGVFGEKEIRCFVAYMIWDCAYKLGCSDQYFAQLEYLYQHRGELQTIEFFNDKTTTIPAFYFLGLLQKHQYSEQSQQLLLHHLVELKHSISTRTDKSFFNYCLMKYREWKGVDWPIKDLQDYPVVEYVHPAFLEATVWLSEKFLQKGYLPQAYAQLIVLDNCVHKGVLRIDTAHQRVALNKLVGDCLFQDGTYHKAVTSYDAVVNDVEKDTQSRQGSSSDFNVLLERYIFALNINNINKAKDNNKQTNYSIRFAFFNGNC